MYSILMNEEEFNSHVLESLYDALTPDPRKSAEELLRWGLRLPAPYDETRAKKAIEGWMKSSSWLVLQ